MTALVASILRHWLGIRSPSLDDMGTDITRGFADGLANPKPLTEAEMADMVDKARRVRDLHFPDE